MSKRLTAFFFITIIVFLGLEILPGRAQEQFRLSALEVDLWPEYDRPGILVIYRITVSPSVLMPVSLSFRIPAAAGNPSAVAERRVTASGEKGLYNIPYERQVSGEWSSIILKATTPEIQVEYYDPGLVRSGAMRHFEYSWPGDYAVDALKILIQQPLGAGQMRISPVPDVDLTGSDGLMYYKKQVGSLPAQQTFRLSIDYQKESEGLTAANLRVQSGGPLSKSVSGQNSLEAVLPWILGGLGVVLIIGGGVWYWRSEKSKGNDKSSNRPRSAAKKEPDVAEGKVFCRQCGKRAAPGDDFCGACGTRLRAE